MPAVTINCQSSLCGLIIVMSEFPGCMTVGNVKFMGGHGVLPASLWALPEATQWVGGCWPLQMHPMVIGVGPVVVVT